MKLPILFFANFIASVAMGIALTIIPWELAKTTGGAKVLAFTATWATTALIFISPIAGRIVDAVSRRFALIVCVVIMGIILQGTSFAYDHPILHIASLSTFYFLSQIFFLCFTNALNAFIQEIFDSNERGKVNGWMTVQLQTSTFIVGLLMIYFVTSGEFKTVLMLNGCLMLLSAFLLRLIPYTKQARPKEARITKAVYLTILKRKDLLLLGIANSSFYVAIMMLNIVHPIYFSNVLNLEVSAIATLSIAWGLGAAVSGFSVSRIVSDKSAMLIMQASIVIYTSGLFIMALYPTFLTIVIVMGICGATGSSSRVAYQTFVMDKVDNNIFGSFQATMQTMAYIQRTIFGAVLAFLIAGFPMSNHYWFVFGIGVFGIITLQFYKVVALAQKLEVAPLKG